MKVDRAILRKLADTKRGGEGTSGTARGAPKKKTTVAGKPVTIREGAESAAVVGPEATPLADQTTSAPTEGSTREGLVFAPDWAVQTTDTGLGQPGLP